MTELRFEWDDRKDADNLRKHGVSFEEARTVFYDEHARLIHDPGHSRHEERYILLGMSSRRRIVLVCHCYRSGEDVIRIISARKASQKERKEYEEKNR